MQLCLPLVYNPCNNLECLVISGESATSSKTINILYNFFSLCFSYNQLFYVVYQLFSLNLDDYNDQNILDLLLYV
jgi:hypothetical protein